MIREERERAGRCGCLLGGVACRGALLAGKVRYRKEEGGVDEETKRKKTAQGRCPRYL